MAYRKRLIIILIIVIAAAGAGTGWFIYYKIHNKPDADEYISEVQISLNNKKYETAIDKCTEALKHYPDEAQLYILKAKAYGYNGENDKAIGILDYGYKQTHDESLTELKNDYVTSTEGDESFLPADENAEIYYPQENVYHINQNSDVYTRESGKAYITTDIADVYIPDVVIPETSPAADAEDTEKEPVSAS